MDDDLIGFHTMPKFFESFTYILKLEQAKIVTGEYVITSYSGDLYQNVIHSHILYKEYRFL